VGVVQVDVASDAVVGHGRLMGGPAAAAHGEARRVSTRAEFA
jgi:hypothetical protein